MHAFWDMMAWHLRARKTLKGACAMPFDAVHESLEMLEDITPETIAAMRTIASNEYDEFIKKTIGASATSTLDAVTPWQIRSDDSKVGSLFL